MAGDKHSIFDIDYKLLWFLNMDIKWNGLPIHMKKHGVFRAFLGFNATVVA